MNDAHARASTRNSTLIKAPPQAVYRAFTDPAALAVWLAPGDMTGEVHHIDERVGGGYEMSLYYPASEPTSRGKTTGREDRYTARFLELMPPSRIVEAITFDSLDPAFAGEMIMEVALSLKTAAQGYRSSSRTFHQAFDPRTMRPARSQPLRSWRAISSRGRRI